MWVGKRPESVVLLLTGSIPESQIDHLAVDFHRGGVVIEHCWDVLGGETVLCIAGLVVWVPDEETCFSDATVSNDDELDGDGVL